MPPFKKGDRVRNKYSGKEYVVSVCRFSKYRNLQDGKTYYVELDGEPSARMAIRYKLVPPVLTDEELAAEYREEREKNLARGRELIKRGYTLQADGKTPWSASSFNSEKVFIYKKVDEEVLVTKQVRKDI